MNSIYKYVSTLSTNKLAFIDIDNTLTANPWDTNEKDLLDKDLTNNAIEELQNHGFFCVITTSRTTEMCMSEKQYELSKKNYGFSRPPPHMGIDNNQKRYYIKPEEFFPTKILDLPIIISSSGAQITVLQEYGGYMIDQTFYPGGFPNPTAWRIKTTSYLSSLGVPFSYGPIENEITYHNNETDVFPADYRIQIIFTSDKDMLLMTESIKKNDGLFFTNDSNSKKNLFMGYITPKNGKIDAIEHVLGQFETLNHILIIGDSIPDLEAGLRVKTGEKGHITFLLVGGSCLSLNLLPASSQTRKIIVGDVLFPGTIGPRTIVEFLRKKDYNRNGLGS